LETFCKAIFRNVTAIYGVPRLIFQLIAVIFQSKTSRINSLKNMIENYQTRIETAQEKLKKLNQKLSNIQSGTLSTYLSFDSKKAQLLLRLEVKNVLKNGTKT
jgi:uncharacterized coiled-coil protein SlyX